MKSISIIKMISFLIYIFSLLKFLNFCEDVRVEFLASSLVLAFSFHFDFGPRCRGQYMSQLRRFHLLVFHFNDFFKETQYSIYQQ